MGRRPDAGPKTRPGDISSEGSDDDEVQFDPMVVVRDSDEGKMMDKWLQAARRRLGGMFPRPEARKSMERYAEKMRQRKLKEEDSGRSFARRRDGSGRGEVDCENQRCFFGNS